MERRLATFRVTDTPNRPNTKEISTDPRIFENPVIMGRFVPIARSDRKGRIPTISGFTGSRVDTYLTVSISLFVLLSAALAMDVYQMVINSERTSFTTRDVVTTVLCLHTLAFYESFLAFVFVTQALHKQPRKRLISMISLVINTLLLVYRIMFEVTFIYYRPEFYSI